MSRSKRVLVEPHACNACVKSSHHVLGAQYWRGLARLEAADFSSQYIRQVPLNTRARGRRPSPRVLRPQATASR